LFKDLNISSHISNQANIIGANSGINANVTP
jgi:hypothetical protein